MEQKWVSLTSVIILLINTDVYMYVRAPVCVNVCVHDCVFVHVWVPIYMILFMK